MPDDEVVGRLDVFRLDAASEDPTRIGELELSASGKLAIIGVAPDYDGKLRDAVAAANAKDAIAELVPATIPAARFATSAKVTRRGEAGFFEALNRYMQRYHSFSLG